MTHLLQLFNEFMHIYFWVFLVAFILYGIALATESLEAKDSRVSFFGLVSWTLWIMSWHY